MKLCALVVGHKKTSPGVINKQSGMTEFKFNDVLSQDIEPEVPGVLVQRVYRRTYNSLPIDINELNPDFIVSLHCNAFNAHASGTEVLFYHRSSKGKQYAEVLNEYLVQALGLPNRGVKPKTSEDRGGYLFIEHMYSKYKIIQNNKKIITNPLERYNDNDERRGVEVYKMDAGRFLLIIRYSGGSGMGERARRIFAIYVNGSAPILMSNFLEIAHKKRSSNKDISNIVMMKDIVIKNNKLHLTYAYGTTNRATQKTETPHTYKHIVPMTPELPQEDECEFIMKANYGNLPKQ